ncbi:MAG: chromosome segregation protein SMC [Alphaproteobacteria bacterium]
MIQFAKLRLSGFKSFIDRTELDIGPGLNGIVGPNGCGKSNLVEALRWVMGENSAKRMRGGGMEDVIFAGTTKRSARNFAEVSLILDNTSRQAPAAYNSNNEIEVIRKIEKDKGSGYKINGKNARARDVQMLFADTVTGANSPSLVSQGHVTRMINAKPHDRRLILEESAGIAGLYARRHEAELRLRAADSNLVRVEDILGSMEGRLNSLKRQARQASKYKSLSAQIRQLELVIIYLEWLSLHKKQKETKGTFSSAESLVAQNLTAVTQLTKTQNTQVEDLPALRKSETEKAAHLQKYTLEFERLESEAARHQQDIQDTKTQTHQNSIDLQHEEQILEENTELLEKIEVEHKSLLLQQEKDSNSHEDKKDNKEKLFKQLVELEERFTALKETAAESRARESSLVAQIERNQGRMDILQGRLSNAQEEKNALTIDENIQKNIQDLENKTEEIELYRQGLSQKTDHYLSEIEKSEHGTEESRNIVSQIEKRYAEFSAELSMLEKIVNSDTDDVFTPVLDDITTKSGFEKALSRALGDSLMASLESEAPTSWQNSDISVDDLPPLPAGVQSLKPHVKAPVELSLTLSQIGFVESYERGQEIYTDLNIGQALVSADGYYWRWDGYHVQASATDRHSVYLEQKNKLFELTAQKTPLEAELSGAKDVLDQALNRQSKAKEEYSTLLNDIKQTEAKLKELRPALQKIKEKDVRTQSERKRYSDQIESLQEDISALSETIGNDQIALDALRSNQESSHNDETIQNTKENLDDLKVIHQDAVREFDLLEQTQSTRNARIQAIADERVSLKNRTIRAKERLKKLSDRQITLDEKLQALQNAPLHVTSSQSDMLDKITELEKERDIAAEKLAIRESEVAETSTALKEAEQILGQAREERARAQALYASVDEQLNTMEQSIRNDLQMSPQELSTHVSIDLVKHQIDDLHNLKQQKDNVVRERDTIGPVNLRAEEEASELEKELTTLLHERNDLIQAIEELRGGINKINKEARERLLVAFDHVNAHFQDLFQRLFKGGKAHLELIDSDDPLGAGLEIFAQPPGKALQSLSLLSGGEQTLASIALIFGMFLTNPSPICVLDEIDAPLDDANVDRVCDLIEEIAERGETRFLIITHHRLSMARMDRLYGVTMSEKGVSQLVSVDLQQSFDFIDKKVA